MNTLKSFAKGDKISLKYSLQKYIIFIIQFVVKVGSSCSKITTRQIIILYNLRKIILVKKNTKIKINIF